MSYLDNKVIGEIIKIDDKNEVCLSKVNLWENLLKDGNFYEEIFLIYGDQEILKIFPNGNIRIKKNLILKESRIIKNNTSYLKIELVNNISNIMWNKMIPHYNLDIHKDILDKFNIFDLYVNNTLNFYKYKNEYIIFRFSRNQSMFNIVLKNGTIYLLIKENEIQKIEENDYICY